MQKLKFEAKAQFYMVCVRNEKDATKKPKDEKKLALEICPRRS